MSCEGRPSLRGQALQFQVSSVASVWLVDYVCASVGRDHQRGLRYWFSLPQYVLDPAFTFFRTVVTADGITQKLNRWVGVDDWIKDLREIRAEVPCSPRYNARPFCVSGVNLDCGCNRVRGPARLVGMDVRDKVIAQNVQLYNPDGSLSPETSQGRYVTVVPNTLP